MAEACFVYVIESTKRSFVYVGLSFDVEQRLKQHNAGYNRSTAPYRPFRILLIEQLGSRSEARTREKFLKSGKGRELLRPLRSSYRDTDL